MDGMENLLMTYRDMTTRDWAIDAAVTLAAYLLPKIESGEWKRMLFVPTGALLSTVSFNEGQSVPGIAHAVVIEHC